MDECIFCRSKEHLVQHRGKAVCRNCIQFIYCKHRACAKKADREPPPPAAQ